MGKVIGFEGKVVLPPFKGFQPVGESREFPLGVTQVESLPKGTRCQHAFHVRHKDEINHGGVGRLTKEPRSLRLLQLGIDFV